DRAANHMIANWPPASTPRSRSLIASTARIKRRGVEMRLVIKGRSASPTTPDPVLLKEIRRAHRCFEALVSGVLIEMGDPSLAYPLAGDHNSVQRTQAFDPTSRVRSLTRALRSRQRRLAYSSSTLGIR